MAGIAKAVGDRHAEAIVKDAYEDVVSLGDRWAERRRGAGIENVVARAVREFFAMENVVVPGPLSSRELERAVRDAIISEQEAIKQYESIVDATDNSFVSRVLQSIADEEKVHVGELRQLLETISEDEAGLVDEGRDEARVEMFEKEMDV